MPVTLFIVYNVTTVLSLLLFWLELFEIPKSPADFLPNTMVTSAVAGLFTYTKEKTSLNSYKRSKIWNVTK